MDEDDVYAMLKERKSKKKNPRNKGGGATSSGGKGKGMSEEEKRAAIRAGLARKKECEKRALGIVERMIETEVDREWLRSSVGTLTTMRIVQINFQYPVPTVSHDPSEPLPRRDRGACRLWSLRLPSVRRLHRCCSPGHDPEVPHIDEG